MAITETNITCTICNTFKRITYEDKMPALDDWKKFVVERDGSTKNRYICPDCIKAFEAIITDYIDKQTPKFVTDDKSTEELETELKELEKLVDKDQVSETIPKSRPKPKKRGRPKKKGNKK